MYFIMQDFVAIHSHPEKTPPLSEYISLPSLAYAKDLSRVLDSVSFSQEQKDGSHFLYLHYTEWSVLYTLWWCSIYYTLHTARVSTFATANLRWLKPSYKQQSHFASKTHLLRTPVSWLWSTLFKHVIDTIKQQNIAHLKISSDATSVPFYIKMSQNFSDHFSHIDTNHTKYSDGWCDFHFTFKQ